MLNLKNTFALLLLALQITVVHSAETADSDHDGVPDALDKCPNSTQIKKLAADFKYAAAVDPERLKPGKQAYPVDTNGCEFDNDGDGVVNSLDYCPDDSKEALSKDIAANGCPQHSDKDGTPDYRDKCPNTPQGVKTDQYGCKL